VTTLERRLILANEGGLILSQINRERQGSRSSSAEKAFAAPGPRIEKDEATAAFEYATKILTREQSRFAQ
jgi:hypothetical protein